MKQCLLLCLFIALYACDANDDPRWNSSAQSDSTSNVPTEAPGGNQPANDDTILPINDPTIQSGSAQDLLRHVVSAVNEDEIRKFLRKWQRPFGGNGRWIDFSPAVTPGALLESDQSAPLDSTTVSYIDLVDKPATSEISTYSHYVCVAGGEIHHSVVAGILDEYLINDCIPQEFILSGRVLRFVVSDRPSVVIGDYMDLTVIDPADDDAIQVLSGRFRDGYDQTFFGENYFSSWSNLNYSGTASGERYTLKDFNLSREESLGNINTPDQVDFEARINTKFTLTSEQTQQLPYQVSIDLTMENPNSVTFRWQQGLIEITAPDGSFMRVQPNPDNVEDFFITFHNNESIGPFKWYDGYEIKLSRHWYDD